MRGKTVNIKWYLKREGMLDMTEADSLHFYLDNVYLFDAQQPLAEQRARGVKMGVASSIPAHFRTAAEIYPADSNPLLLVSAEQAALLRLFRS